MNLSDAASIKIGTTDAIEVRLGSISIWSPAGSEAAEFLTYDNSSLGTIENPELYSRTISNPRDSTAWNDSRLDSTYAWLPLNSTRDFINSSNTTEWLQLDLGENQSVTGLITQGADRYNNWIVTKYRVEYCDEASIQFSVSGMASNTNSDTYFNSSNVGHYEVNGTYNGKVQYVASGESNSVIRYNSSNDKWEFVNDGDEYYSSDYSGYSNPWAVRSWEVASNGSGSAQSEVVLTVDQNTFTDVDNGAEFTRDKDQGTKTLEAFTAPVTARYVTLFPTFFQGAPTIRVGVLIDGVEVALTPEFSGSSTVDWGDLNTDTLVDSTTTTHVFNPVYEQPIYSTTIAGNIANVDEGSSVTFNVATINVPNGTTLYYSLNRGVPDFTSDERRGEFTINNNAGSFTVTPLADETTEARAEGFRAEIRTGSVNGTIVDFSDVIYINDTSQTPAPGTPTYDVTTAGNVTSVNEGSSLTFNVATTNVADGTTLYYTIGNNAGDFSTTNGTFTINSNTGSFAVTPTADSATEGAETFTVQIRTGGVGGTIVKTSNSITINDTSTGTSQTPTSLTVTVVNDYGSNKFVVEGSSSYNLSFTKGTTYIFDVSDSTNSTHPLSFSTSSNPFFVNQYSGVSSSGTPGQTGATVTLAIDANYSGSEIYMYCTTHGVGMGDYYNPIPVT